MRPWSLLALLALAACDAAEAPPGRPAANAPGAPAAPGVRARLLQAYAAGADWLVSQQDEAGAWKMGPPGQQMRSPSYTGLMVTALGGAPPELRATYTPAVDKAVAFIVSKSNLDGSVGEGPAGSFLKTYTTAICLMALGSVERTDKVANAIRGAQAYLKQNQLKEGATRGGSGYGDDVPAVKDGQVTTKKAMANLSTTGFTATGLKMSGLPQDDEFWKLVVEFVRKCQNSSEVNTDAAFTAALQKAGLSVGNDGGLYYGPYADRDVQKAGTVKVADREAIQSYGSMTYEGIKTYIYAGLAKDSPEVKAAIDWVRKNYSVEAHPGFVYDERQRHHLRGLYYYYLVMARALDAYGEHPFKTFDGKEHDWAREVAEQLLKQAKESKMWVNANPAWYEGDPVMVTSYALSTSNVLFKYVK